MAIELPAVRILIVDDDRAICDYMQTLLERDGYTVKALSDPTQVETEIRTGGYHLMILDLMMPNLDGIGLLRAIRDDPALAGIPLVLLSARAGEEATLDAIAAAGVENARDYSARDVYLLGEVVRHPTFGLGIVRAVRPDKVDVAFKTAERILVHGRTAAPNPASRPAFHPPHRPSDVSDDAAE